MQPPRPNLKEGSNTTAARNPPRRFPFTVFLVHGLMFVASATAPGVFFDPQKLLGFRRAGKREKPAYHRFGNVCGVDRV